MTFGGLRCCLFAVILSLSLKEDSEEKNSVFKAKTWDLRLEISSSHCRVVTVEIRTVVTGGFFKPLDFAQVSHLIMY